MITKTFFYSSSPNTSCPLTVFDFDGELYVDAAQLCTILGFKNHKTIIKRHINPHGIKQHLFVDKDGFHVKQIISRESMWALIFYSKAKHITTFIQWVNRNISLYKSH